MGGRMVISTLYVTLFCSAAVLAQNQTPQHPMTFFVASAVPGSGKLGGLIGADRICQTLAQAHGAGNHTWHAYLSTQTTPQTVEVNARDRIGPGPWYNAEGVLIAANVADLHGDVRRRDSNNIQKATALSEKGATGTRNGRSRERARHIDGLGLGWQGIPRWPRHHLRQLDQPWRRSSGYAWSL